MTNLKKRFCKLFNKKEIPYHEIKTILNSIGYKLDRIKGSHYIFKKNNKELIRFPVHHNLVKRCYIKTIILKINPLINEAM